MESSRDAMTLLIYDAPHDRTMTFLTAHTEATEKVIFQNRDIGHRFLNQTRVPSHSTIQRFLPIDVRTVSTPYSSKRNKVPKASHTVLALKNVPDM